MQRTDKKESDHRLECHVATFGNKKVKPVANRDSQTNMNQTHACSPCGQVQVRDAPNERNKTD